MECETSDHQAYVYVFCFTKINILIAFWGQKCLNDDALLRHACNARCGKEEEKNQKFWNQHFLVCIRNQLQKSRQFISNHYYYIRIKTS